MYLKTNVKAVGETGITTAELDLTYKNRFVGAYIPEAYERLILDVFNNEHANFVRNDGRSHCAPTHHTGSYTHHQQHNAARALSVSPRGRRQSSPSRGGCSRRCCTTWQPRSPGRTSTSRGRAVRRARTKW